jgi:hypothetical protein
VSGGTVSASPAVYLAGAWPSIKYSTVPSRTYVISSPGCLCLNAGASGLSLNLRVADLETRYEQWKAKGAEFVTPADRPRR